MVGWLRRCYVMMLGMIDSMLFLYFEEESIDGYGMLLATCDRFTCG
jgi:hypothetical protein